MNGIHWKANPAIQKFIRDHGLKDEAGLQAHFNRRVETIVRKHGKKMMGWDEVLHPDLPRDVLVQSWRDHESLAKAVKQGHRTLLSFGYYLDHLDTSKVYYLVDPLGGPAAGLSEAEAQQRARRRSLHVDRVRQPGDRRFAHLADDRRHRRAALVAARHHRPRVDVRASRHRQPAVGLARRPPQHQLRRHAAPALGDAPPLEDLRTLADAVEPLGIEGREITRTYSQSTPLNRFVDAARGESAAVRRAEAAAARVLAGGPDAELRADLPSLAGECRAARPALRRNALLNEAAGVSRDLSRTGEIGMEALARLRSRQAAPEWAAAAWRSSTAWRSRRSKSCWRPCGPSGPWSSRSSGYVKPSIQERSRRPHILKAHDTIVGIAKHDNLSSPWLFSPVLNPEIENVVQVKVTYHVKVRTPPDATG